MRRPQLEEAPAVTSRKAGGGPGPWRVHSQELGFGDQGSEPRFWGQDSRTRAGAGFGVWGPWTRMRTGVQGPGFWPAVQPTEFGGWAWGARMPGFAAEFRAPGSSPTGPGSGSRSQGSELGSGSGTPES